MSSPGSEGRDLEEVRSRLEVINIEGDDFEDKSEGTFDLEEPLNPLYDLPDAHGTPSKKDKDAQNICLKQKTSQDEKGEEGSSPVLFDLKSPLGSMPPGSNPGSGPLTYTVLEEENMDPDSLVEEESGEKDCTSDKEEHSSVDPGVESSTYSNEGFEEDQEDDSSPRSESLSSPERSSCSSSREPGINSSDQSSAQDQKSGVSFFVDFEDEDHSPRGSLHQRLRPPMRRRTNTLDERMTQSVIEDRRSLDSSLSFYVDFSSSDQQEQPSGWKPHRSAVPRPPSLPKKQIGHLSSSSSKFTSKKALHRKVTSPNPKKKEASPPREDSFETIKFFFKKLLKKVDELACTEDRSLPSVRRKKKLAERIMVFLEEEELKLNKGQTLTPESQIDACLSLESSSNKKPALRRERTFDLDSAEPKKLMLVEIEKNDGSKQKRNQKLFSQQKVFFTRRMKREIPKIDKRIKELENQISRDRLPSSKRITARKQCWPMSDRELQIVEDAKPKRRLPAPTYPAPRLPSKKLSQPNRMTQSLIEESPSGGTSTSFLEIASKKQRSKERIKINVTDRSGLSPSYSWYLNQDFSSNEDFEPEDEIVWIRRESPRRFYYEERSFYSPTVLQRRSRFSDPEESSDYVVPLNHAPRQLPRRANMNNFGQTFPSPSRKNSEALMSSGLAVRKTKGPSSRMVPPPVASSPIASRGVQTRELTVYSPPWEESSHAPLRGATEVRRTEYIDLDTDEYVMESRRKIVSPPMKKTLPFSSKIPKTRSPYESRSSSSAEKKSSVVVNKGNRSKDGASKAKKAHSRDSNI